MKESSVSDKVKERERERKRERERERKRESEQYSGAWYLELKTEIMIEI